MNPNVTSRAHADLALAVYLEPHAEGRRVLLLDDAQGALADRFDRLATHLEIIDPASREPSRGEVPELPFDDGSFDLVVVSDVGTLPDPVAGALRELHRVLDPAGILALSAPGQTRRRRRGPPVPQQLETLLKAEFRHVQIVSEAPVAGYAVGALARPRGEEFSIDSSLVRDQRAQPERLVGIASDARLAVEPTLWVEVPVPAADETAGSETSDRAHESLVEELRRAEDEAREALHRESDLLRKLESERRARLDAEHAAERAQGLERKLLAAEADYDDAVARVRYFESAIGEHEASTKHEREKREAAERDLGHAKSELRAAVDALHRAQADRDAARAEYERASRELEEQELRLVEVGQQVRELERTNKQHETTARDLLEELRRLEQDKSAAVEHDARVAELEAERDRAVQRSLEAEVAREAAQMRSDELRAELASAAQSSAPAAREESEPRAESDVVLELRSELALRDTALARTQLDVGRLRGECRGLRLRMNEAELALDAAGSPGEQLTQATRQISDLRLRLAHTEAQLHAIREAEPARREREQPKATAPDRRLEADLARAHQRIDELTRELDEADRFAEVHAEDAERLASIEAELEHTRGRIADYEEEVRALEDDLRQARAELSTLRDEVSLARLEAERQRGDAAARLELSERREAERDDARAALAEARSILSQLAGPVGADENDPPSIVQALLAQRSGQHDETERALHGLRESLAQRDARIEQLERLLAERHGSDGTSSAAGDAPASDTPEY